MLTLKGAPGERPATSEARIRVIQIQKSIPEALGASRKPTFWPLLSWGSFAPNLAPKIPHKNFLSSDYLNEWETGRMLSAAMHEIFMNKCITSPNN